MSQPTIELVYDSDCPNVDAARLQLRLALAMAHLKPRWQEWCLSDPQIPVHARGYGSPTILVDQKDVEGRGPDLEGRSCRVYRSDDQHLSGVPSVESLLTAIQSRGP